MPLFGRRRAEPQPSQPTTPAPAPGQPTTPAPESGAPSPAPQAGRIGTRYVMQQRAFALGNDFDIKDERDQVAFHVDGKMRLRHALVFKDAQGREIYKILEPRARVRDMLNVYRGDAEVASIRRKRISPLRDRFDIAVAGGDALQVEGNIRDREYRVERNGRPIALISKTWFRARDTYGVEVMPDEDALLMLAVTVGIDMLSHD